MRRIRAPELLIRSPAYIHTVKEFLMSSQEVVLSCEAGSPVNVNLMRLVDKVADKCLGFSMYVLYPAILTVIFVDVIGRNFFETPLSWAIEGSGLFLIGAIFLAVPRVELDRNHVLLDILYDRYSPKMKLICDMLTRALASLWMLAATIRSSFEIPTAFMLNESGADFRYPFWPMRVIMTFAFLILTLSLVYNVVDTYRKISNKGNI